MKTMNATKKKSLGILITLLSTVILGIHPSAARAVYADGGNAVFVMMAVTVARALGLLSLVFVLRKPLFRTKTDVHTAISGGFFQALSGTCIFLSLTLISGPIAIIIFQLNALMLLFFMAWKGEKKLNPLILLTTFSALGALTLVVDVWRVNQSLHIIGISLAFLSAAATSSRLYIYGHLTKQRDPATVGAEAFAFATLFVMLLLFFKAPQFPASPNSYLWLATGCITMAVGTIGMFYGIALLGAFEYSLLSKIEPLFTAIFAATLIGEFLKPIQYIGMIIVVGSLVAYQYGDFRLKKSKVH